MRTLLVITLCAIALSACKNPNGPQRWSTGPSIQPMGDNLGAPVANSGPPPSQP